MAIKTFKDYPNTETLLNAENLNEMQTSLLDLVYPIGRGFIDFTNTDYSNYLGFVWKKTLIGVTPIGAGTHIDKNGKNLTFEIGEEYGEYEHKLTQQEIPNITINPKYSSSTINVNTGSEATVPRNYPYDKISFGGGESHNNIQPSVAVNYWKRVE